MPTEWDAIRIRLNILLGNKSRVNISCTNRDGSFSLFKMKIAYKLLISLGCIGNSDSEKEIFRGHPLGYPNIGFDSHYTYRNAYAIDFFTTGLNTISFEEFMCLVRKILK